LCQIKNYEADTIDRPREYVDYSYKDILFKKVNPDSVWYFDIDYHDPIVPKIYSKLNNLKGLRVINRKISEKIISSILIHNKSIDRVFIYNRLCNYKNFIGLSNLTILDISPIEIRFSWLYEFEGFKIKLQV